MITIAKGSIFKAKAQALVNPVNTVGVMGAGLAKQFKERFPENYELYRKACFTKELTVGKVFATKSNIGPGPWIVNFPTKKDWRNPSEFDWVAQGLAALEDWGQSAQVSSIAIPPLGCGLGGLPWAAVFSEIEKRYLTSSINAIIYPPYEV